MTYVRLNRPLIPVAQVYGYGANMDNPAKVSFMLIERMPGEHTYDHTIYDMDFPKAEQVLKNIARFELNWQDHYRLEVCSSERTFLEGRRMSQKC